MAADAPAAPTPSADAVSRAVQDAGGVSGASDAPYGVTGVPGAGGASGRDATEGTINAKSSSATFFPFVRLCIVKLWSDLVHARARRPQSRGVSKRLQVASSSAPLVAPDLWVKRLRIKGKPIHRAAASRLISKAVTLYSATNTIKAHDTARAAGYIEGRVNELVREQGKSWRMEYADTKSILSFVIDAQPLVGGVQRVNHPVGGSPSDDGLPGTTGCSGRQGGAGRDGGESHEARTGGEGGGGVRAGVAGVGGGGDCGAANEIFLGDAQGAEDADRDLGDNDGRRSDVDGGDADSLDDSASGSSGSRGEIAPGGGTRPSGGGALAHASPVSVTVPNRCEASGRARRAAVADAAVEALLPGGGDFLRSLAASLSDDARRFNEKQKAQRLVALEAERTTRVTMHTAAIEKHPDNETFCGMLKAAVGGDSS